MVGLRASARATASLKVTLSTWVWSLASTVGTGGRGPSSGGRAEAGGGAADVAGGGGSACVFGTGAGQGAACPRASDTCRAPGTRIARNVTTAKGFRARAL